MSELIALISQFVYRLPVLPFRKGSVYQGYLLARIPHGVYCLERPAPLHHLVVLSIQGGILVSGLYAVILRHYDKAQQVVVEILAVLAPLYQWHIFLRLVAASV